ncbi:hypothetical protein RRG08_015534 [Elysia crispata]|uniref:Uncharacterized protein n=1 Tax=Elysia crispata TaxID=231223 RepID=A0AAE0YJP7_9GAST|nr:hypothetical protein RRG08_015534 [Elysia crispata]
MSLFLPTPSDQDCMAPPPPSLPPLARAVAPLQPERETLENTRDSNLSRSFSDQKPLILAECDTLPSSLTRNSEEYPRLEPQSIIL